MIKINLLKTFTTSGTDPDGIGFSEGEEQNQVNLDFAKRLVAFLIGPLCFYFYETSKIPELQGQIAAKNQLLADLRQFNEKKKGLAEEIKRYEEDQARLNGQMSFMRKIAEEKVNELKLMEYLQDYTPESVWINKLELKDSELTISAESDVASDISKFIDNLANAQFLAGVSPTNQETKNNSLAEGITTTSFNVRASFSSGAAAQ